MTALFVCWLAFPLVLGVLTYGCGAVVERASGRTLALSIRMPCGVALIIGTLDLATISTATVWVAVPAVCALAVGGLALRPPWRRWRYDRAAVAAVVVFAVYAAPIVLSGMATWAGYVKLDDTATWLALVDRTLTAGHTLSGLGASTYRDTLGAYLTNGYPVGSFLPLGLGHDLLRQDIAWLTDPWMAFMAAMLALSLYGIATRSLGDRAPDWQPIAIAIVASQPALLYGYYLWGGMKEMAGAMLLAAFASVALLPFDGERRVRAAIPALVVVGAILSALSAGGLVWLVPGGALALLLLLRRGIPLPSPRVLLVAGVACVVAAYLVLRPGGFVERYKGELTGSNELGNLLGPLHLRQIVGIWPTGDFRLLPTDLTVTNILIVLTLACGAGGLFVAVRRAHRELALYVLCSLVGALLIFWIGSPWIAGKALATASPTVAFVALVACAMLLAHGRPRALGVLSLLAGSAITVGVVWSNLLGYHAASLAPRAQFVELAAIGHRIAGQGPTLMTDYSPFGARHFLREAEPESASELRSRVDPLLSGQWLPQGTTADIDQFQLSAVLVYRTLVLRRSPSESRPPSPFKLILRDRYWEVWQRSAHASPPVLAHMPLGNVLQPGGVPSCSAVSRLAHTPGAVELIAPPVVNPIVVQVGTGTHPRRWSDGPEHLTLTNPGTARVTLTVAHAGHYALWLGGSISAPVTISINGVAIATRRYEIQEDSQYVPFGTIGLEHGTYVVSIGYDGGDWRPGSGGPPATVGPLMLQREVPERQPIVVPVKSARSLCGRTLDWVEALGS